MTIWFDRERSREMFRGRGGGETLDNQLYSKACHDFSGIDPSLQWYQLAQQGYYKEKFRTRLKVTKIVVTVVVCAEGG